MKRALIVLATLLLITPLCAQSIREFQVDTATYISELVAFTGNSLQSDEEPDFQRFILLFDSLSYEQQMEIIQVSNLMLNRSCHPRPHFIAYQRVMMEFFYEEKTGHGYDQWLEGYRLLLGSDQGLLRNISQWLTLSLSLLESNTFYSSNVVTWKVSTPSFSFQTDETMTVRFDDVTIACYSGSDSIQIHGASGYIDPLKLQWTGSRGRVTWERFGRSEEEIYALLGGFQINLKKSLYSADSVKLYYPALFQEEMLGRLEDKVTVIKNIRTAKYPQFVSYRSSYRIEDFVPGINYRGGLSIEGASLMGIGVRDEPAVMEVFSNDTLRIRAESHRIAMNERFIRSPKTSTSIYFGSDSIFHPDLVFAYDVAREQLRLNKSDDFRSQGPYSNSYHNIDMNFDELYWIRGEEQMKFQALLGSTIGRATFESITFFNYNFFMGLQGMDYVHPLAQLYSYSQMVHGRTFNSGPYASYTGYAEYQVKHQLMALAKLGFVYFDDATSMITLRQKMFDYMDASLSNRDYDVIRFNSRTEGVSNAELDLKTSDLTIRGIPVIFLSDSQNVRLIPRGNKITMKKNRSFEFDGVVDAGYFRFTGRDFFFQYDSFKIDLPEIDSLQLSISTGGVNEYGNPIVAMIDNAMEHMTGELLIDDPDNKSGLEHYPKYPIFTSQGNSFIFFDSPNIQHGVYDREAFYFELDPFAIDSLDNFNPAAISPSGTFTSAGILPPLQMEMTLRDDNSLGFYMQTPEEGIDLYRGVGRFYNDIEMSSQGLQGFGSFDYLTSTTWSDRFLMHPDSLMARSRRLLVREKRDSTEFPYVENTEADVKLIPGDSVMHLVRVEETFRIFSDSVYHGGNLDLSPTGLTGTGVMALREARLESDRYWYESRSISSDSASVQFRGTGMKDFAFLTDDVSLRIDMNARKGQFASNQDQTRIELPYNLYETKLDKITWFMDEGKVGLSQHKLLSRNNVDIGIDSLKTNGPTYTSTHPGQDDLHFVAPRATYNYRTRRLQAKRVPFIEVADAYIFPDAGDVEIGYQASMELLTNARVLANQENRQHLIYDASIAVNGALDYTGSGTYDYRDAFGNSHAIYFDRIWVDSSIVSYSAGRVDDDDPFMLSPFFDFQGEALLTASDSNLIFDGGVRIMHDCNIDRSWLRFTSEIDPSDIRIPVEEKMVNVSLNKIIAGSMITRDSTHIYPAFLTSRKDYFDKNITNASGTLIYDPEKERYILTGDEKHADPTLPGTYLELGTANCELYGEGPVDLTLDYGQVKIKSTGNTLHRVSEDQFSANLVLGLDFLFSPEALLIMGGEIDSLPRLEPVDLTTPRYRLAMRDLLGETEAHKLERQLALTGVYDKIPPSWQHTIFFNELPLKWNQETRSFRHNGKVGIGNIGDIQVNKKVDAYIELVEKGSGDILDIYLKVDRRTWYYIAYSPGGLQVLSSNSAFNDLVLNIKAADRRIKAKVGQSQYIYSLAAQRRLDLFIERFMEYENPSDEEEEY
ncbi:MAG: hypothetical protein ABFS10_06335 [Bacteroidota bacterium]